MSEFLYNLKIPKERVAILIGKKGKTKRELEKQTKTNIKIDSKEGDITIKGDDALGLYAVREVIKAVGRGFNPEIAKQLLKQDWICEYVGIPEFVKSRDQYRRLRSRIIGSEGKARKTIEKLTNTYLSVCGKTVAIIGQSDDVLRAKKAVEALLRGAPHSHAYYNLEKTKKYKE